MDAQNAVNHNLIGSYIVRDTTHVTFYICAKSSMTTCKNVFNSACFERSYYYKMKIKINNSFNEIYSINNSTLIVCISVRLKTKNLRLIFLNDDSHVTSLMKPS